MRLSWDCHELHPDMTHRPTSAVLQVSHSPCLHSTHCHADAHPSRDCHAARDAGQVSPCVNCNIKCKGCHGIREVSHSHSSAHLLHDCHEPCDALREHHQPSIQQNDVRCQNWEEQNSIFASRNSEMERSLLLYVPQEPAENVAGYPPVCNCRKFSMAPWLVLVSPVRPVPEYNKLDANV